MKKLVFFTITVLVAGQGFAGGLNPIGGIGSRNGAMSGSYSDDSALFADNPAQMVAVKGTEDGYWDFGLQAIWPKFKIKNRLAEQSSKSKAYPSPTMGYIRQLSDELTVGVGVTVPYGLGAAFDRNWRAGVFASETLISLVNTTPAFALKLTDRLTFGLGLNVGLCQFEYDAPFDIKGVYIPILTESNAHGFGLGAITGLRWQASDKVVIGLSYMSEEKTSLRGRTRISGPLGLLEITDHFRSEFTFPDKVNLSASWQVSEKWLLAAAYHWYGYSQNVDNMALDFERLPLVKTKPLDWRDDYSVHVGGRATLSDDLQMSFGVGWQIAAIPKTTAGQLTPDATGWDLSAGLHYQKPNGWLINLYAIYGWGGMAGQRGIKYEAKTITVGASLNKRF